jgi:hypothetical protein
MHLKTLFILLLANILCFLTGSLSAQPPQFQSQLNTMRFNNQMDLQNRMMMQMNMMNYRDRNFNPSYTFVVTMKDSSKMVFDSQILNDTILKKNYVLFVDKKFKRSDSNRYRKIYPSQTIKIDRRGYDIATVGNRQTVVRQNVYNTGNATDSCWVFKVLSGPISAYSSLSEMFGDALFKPFAMVAIQLNDGPIVKYTLENLKQMVEQNADAMKSIEEKDYYKAIKDYNKAATKAAKKKSARGS